MRPSLAVSLLLLSLLISEVQGIRFDRGSFMSFGHKSNKEEEQYGHDLIKTSNGSDDVEEASLCNGGHECNSSGKTRKLITMIINTTTTTSKKNNAKSTASKSKISKEVGGKEEHLSVEFPAPATSSEKYPEIVDIAEMDYSPARRKPPIHN